MAVCACSSATSASKLPKSTTSTTATTSTTTLSVPAATSTTTTSVPGNGSSAPQDIVPDQATEAQLEAAYAAYMGDPPQDIAGTEQGSVYEAYLPPAATYWALARFLPTSDASEQTVVGMQDGGNIGIFDKSASGSWTMIAKGTSPFCPSRSAIPAEVQSLWGLTDPPQCSS